MIIPRPRLLLVAGALLLTASIIYALDPGFALPLAVAVLAFAILSFADAAISGRLLVQLRASLPPVVRLTKEREGAIPILFSNLTGRALFLEAALALPESFRSGQETFRVALHPATAEAQFLWPCMPLQRGRYRLEHVYAAAASPLGLWDYRHRFAASAELHVYPNLQKERSRLAAIFLNKGNLGIHAQRRVGKGRDFEQLREYIPGDSIEDIHWKATARRAHPVTKVFQLERTQEIYVIIDSSRLSGRVVEQREEGPATLQLEYFITAAMTLGLVAQKQGDLFGVAAFSDSVGQFLRAGSGLAHFNAVREAIYALAPKPVNPDFEELFTFLRLRLRRRALLLFLTNLDDPVLAESFTKHLSLLSRRHLVLVNMAPPPEIRPVFSTPDVANVEEVYERLGAHLQWRDLRELQHTLRRSGVAMHLLANATLAPELVSQYVNVKQRQLI